MPDALECTSTNCGNNITYLLDLMREKGFDCGSFLLIQDASMQRRMEAGLRKYAPEARIVNYAAYQAEFAVRENHLAFTQPIFGMWQPKRYIDLLMGEIPRLRDDADGYGRTDADSSPMLTFHPKWKLLLPSCAAIFPSVRPIRSTLPARDFFPACNPCGVGLYFFVDKFPPVAAAEGAAL